mgnify:CR=1 FL=1
MSIFRSFDEIEDDDIRKKAIQLYFTEIRKIGGVDNSTFDERHDIKDEIVRFYTQKQYFGEI